MTHNIEKATKQGCVICGFNKCVALHHIIKRSEGGSNNGENLVYLCLNHHWVADFGESEEREKILRMIKERTGKGGVYSHKKDLLDKKVRMLIENMLYRFSEEKWERCKDYFNYKMLKMWLMGRGGISGSDCINLNKKAEKLIINREKLNFWLFS